jgi:hypothetical protein
MWLKFCGLQLEIGCKDRTHMLFMKATVSINMILVCFSLLVVDRLSCLAHLLED